MKTKPRGIHATFETDCANCGGVLTVSNGRPDRHECHPRTAATDSLYQDVFEPDRWTSAY